MKNKTIFKQEVNNSVCWIITALSALFPLLSICFDRFGYSIVLRYPNVILSVTMLLYVVITVFACINREHSVGKPASIVLIFAFPASIINGFFVFLSINSVISFVFCIISSVCVLVISLTLCRYFTVMIFYAVISALSYAIIVILGFFSLVFGGLRSDTVIAETDSPDGRYTAVIISSDQGAMGGDTLVNIESNGNSRNFLLSEIKKDPETVWFGNWGEHERLNIQWIDNNTLSINGEITCLDD